MFGQLDNKETEALLHQQIIGRIGCHGDGITYVVPISYAYDGEYVYGHAYEGRKLEIMRKNPQVCFQVENTKNLANWKSVISWGVFEEMDTPEERLQALQVLNKRKLPLIVSDTMRMGDQSPFNPDSAEQVPGVFFRIRLGEKTGRYERSADEYFFAT